MKPQRIALLIFAADFVWFAVAMVLAGILRYGSAAAGDYLVPRGQFIPLLEVAWLVWGLLSVWLTMDGFRAGWRPSAVVSQLFLAVVSTISILEVGSHFRHGAVSQLFMGYLGFLLLGGVIAIRWGLYSFLAARHRSGHSKRTVIVGTGRIARELASKIERHPEMMCKVIGFLQLENAPMDFTVPNEKADSVVALSAHGVLDLLQSQAVDELILAIPLPAFPQVLNLIGRCREMGINVALVPQPYELYLSKPNLLELEGLPLLQFQQPSNSMLQDALKRTVDITFGLTLILMTSPILLAMTAFQFARKRPVFRSELRCGLRGRNFSMMRFNVDRPPHPDFVLENFLDQMSFTELPQLWNVVKGEMSLVGPRPESPDRVQRYSDWQRQRLTVKPGITGLAQVNGVRELHSSEEKARFDLQYLLKPSLLTDLSLLLQTCWILAVRLLFSAKPNRAKHLQFSNATVAPARAPFEEKITNAHSSQSSAD